MEITTAGNVIQLMQQKCERRAGTGGEDRPAAAM
jgi:hypothetical protein